jgi:hypothetical protein
LSKFDKYGGSQPLLPGQGAKGTALRPSRAAEEIAKAEALASQSDAADRLIFGDPTHVAIALDATGSMAQLLRATKDAIGEIIARVSREADQPIEIELFVYRDYDIPNRLIERSGRTPQPQRLIGWLSGVEALGGGANEGEAVEAALEAILGEGTFGVVLLAGDEPSNGANTVAQSSRDGRTARDLARALGQQKVPVHSFVVGNDVRTVADFRLISELSGGKSGRMDGSKEMIDLAVMAILDRLKGAAGVRKYMEGRQLTDNSQAFGQQLLLGKGE